MRTFDPEVSEATKAGAVAFRALCESALTAAGLHLAAGAQLWQIYRDFELQLEGGEGADEKQVCGWIAGCSALGAGLPRHGRLRAGAPACKPLPGRRAAARTPCRCPGGAG